MAVIVERSGRFMARVQVKGYPRVAKTFSKRADAEAWGRRTQADMEAGRWKAADKQVPILREAMAEYRRVVLPSLRGADRYGYWFDELAAHPVARLPLDKIGPSDLAAWRDQLSARLAPGTVLRRIGLFSGFLSWCQRDQGWIAHNPMAQVRKPKAPEGRDRVLSSSEQDYLLQAAQRGRTTWLADTILVLLRTAMRRGELWGLEAWQIDPGTATVRLEMTKNGSARDVPLCPDAHAALVRMAAQAKREGRERLLPSADPHGISLAFRRTVAAARRRYEADCRARGEAPAKLFLQGIRLHDLRHSAVTSWAGTGGLNLIELAAVSGHRSLRMLKRYSHLKASDVAAKLATLTAADTA